MDTPFLRIEDSGEVIPLGGEVTTVGRGRGADIRLEDPKPKDRNPRREVRNSDKNPVAQRS